MDPVSVFGLLGSIVTIVDLGFKIVKSADEIRGSNDGLNQENSHANGLITTIHDLSADLESSTSEPKNKNERALCSLASECQKVSNDLIKLLEKIGAQNSKSKTKRLRSAFKQVYYKD
jgi:hypothetical protein